MKTKKGMPRTSKRKRKKRLIRSPLRYPGAKLRLLEPITETLKINSVRVKLFCEPFGGGLSVSLRLLSTGLVERIAIGERDALVAAFWKAVFYDTEWLIGRIRTLDISIETWTLYREKSCKTNRERALTCFFLNRTSFSGILADGAGPIGGQEQSSEYDIGCRFNKDDLISRIRGISKLRDKVEFVQHGDWKLTISRALALGYEPDEVFFYLDPPFFEKADRLYRYFFEEKDHRELCDFLNSFRYPWLLSYDNAPEILQMYSSNGNGTHHVEHLYSIASAGTRQKTQELFITNLRRLAS